MCGGGGGVVPFGGGVQFQIYFYFLPFLQEFSLKSCKFLFSCYVFFSPALLNFEQCFL